MLGRNRETIITIKGVEVIVFCKRENKDNNITTEHKKRSLNKQKE